MSGAAMFRDLPLLVVGDIMLDSYISGSASRVSPEAPVPVVSKHTGWSVPGGAANVARGVARLGARPKLIGLVGNDSAGEALRQQIAAEGVEAGLIRSNRRKTTSKTRVLAGGQQLLRIDDESVLRPDLEEKVAMRVHLDELLPDCRALVLSDYGKGVLLPDAAGHSLCQTAMEKAHALGIPVLVDPKGVDWDRYAGADCVTPNSGEFTRICAATGLWQGEREPGGGERQKLAAALCERYGFGRLLLTRGSRGMTLYEPRSAPENIRAVSREVADVSGAGDTVIAVLAAAAALGQSWPEAARLANAAAGVAVTKLGTAPVSALELSQALQNSVANPKLFSQNEIMEKLADWRRDRRRIVFTNGCFDLLHPGHVALLRQAASFGDRLVVGLNSDESVKRLKGEARPIQDEESRALVLAALQMVDAVVVFGEDTPERLIRAIRPDVLVKGSDYKIKDIAGAEFVQSYGGQVRLADLVKGCSTTALAAKIKAGENDENSRG